MAQRIPERPDIPGGHIVEEWIKKAEGDLHTAERELAVEVNPNFEAVCFHCQQAVEKLMKALLVRRGINPPKVHDLADLEQRLIESGLEWSWPHIELHALTLAAVYYRYPRASPSGEDARQYFDIASRIWGSLRPLI